MKKPNVSLVLAVLALSLSATAAMAGPRLSLVGAATLPVNTGSSLVTGALGGFGGGALAEFDAGAVGIEAGGIYAGRKFTALGFSSTSNFIHIPVLVRFGGMSPVSFGVGGFYEIATASGGGSNLGLEGSVRFGVPLGTNVSFIVDGRYLYGLKDLGAGFKSGDIMALAGISFHAK